MCYLVVCTRTHTHTFRYESLYMFELPQPTKCIEWSLEETGNASMLTHWPTKQTNAHIQRSVWLGAPMRPPQRSHSWHYQGNCSPPEMRYIDPFIMYIERDDIPLLIFY